MFSFLRRPDPVGWLNLDEDDDGRRLVGLVRLLNWRRWSAEVSEAAVVFGPAESAPINVAFIEGERGVEVIASEGLGQFQQDRLAMSVMSILLFDFPSPEVGWWWLDLRSTLIDRDLFLAVPPTRPLSLGEARFISTHPNPEILL